MASLSSEIRGLDPDAFYHHLIDGCNKGWCALACVPGGGGAMEEGDLWTMRFRGSLQQWRAPGSPGRVLKGPEGCAKKLKWSRMSLNVGDRAQVQLGGSSKHVVTGVRTHLVGYLLLLVEFCKVFPDSSV